MGQINFDELKELDFFGVDVNLEISLMEYGLLYRKLDDGEYEFIYVTEWKGHSNPQSFDVATFTESDIKDKFYDLGKENILSFTGSTEQEWLDYDVSLRVYDLIQYYGTENIFGLSYYPFSKLQLNDWITQIKNKMNEV